MGYNKNMWYEQDTEAKAEELIGLLESAGVATLRTKHGHTSHSKLFQYLLEKELLQFNPPITPVAKRSKPPLPEVYREENNE